MKHDCQTSMVIGALITLAGSRKTELDRIVTKNAARGIETHPELLMALDRAMYLRQEAIKISAKVRHVIIAWRECKRAEHAMKVAPTEKGRDEYDDLACEWVKAQKELDDSLRRLDQ